MSARDFVENCQAEGLDLGVLAGFADRALMSLPEGSRESAALLNHIEAIRDEAEDLETDAQLARG